MHDFLRMGNTPIIGLSDTLMSEAHAKYWDLSAIITDNVHGNACLRWRTRSRRDYDMRRQQSIDAFNGYSIIAPYTYFYAQFPKILDQVIGKGIVIVDH
nr:MAG: hypothetical protein BECKTC1821D_GA0114238_103119 [Candidatus Kentron sp. TC]